MAPGTSLGHYDPYYTARRVLHPAIGYDGSLPLAGRSTPGSACWKAGPAASAWCTWLTCPAWPCCPPTP